ncbi:MAG TPA: hypothetical protein VFE13_17635 [Caulobacteraceae bacterium]|jgi:general secretion pathway protein I|nr:hypothetical protein [Caulobacteraceae bacterium]
MSDAEDGSILLEALVSTAVVAAVLAAMFTAIGQWDQQRRQIDDRRTALMIARSQLAAVGSALPLTPGRLQGVEGDFVWSVGIEPGQANALDSSLAGSPSTVTVAVRRAAGGPSLALLRTQQLAGAP